MDIQLTPNGGATIHLCMLPEKIKFGASGKFMSYSIISMGDVKIPRGSSPEEVSWSGKFPGASRKNDAYVRNEFWIAPKEYVREISSWRDKGTKVHVAITGTSINMDMYVQKFEGSYSGGYGDFDYDISFVKARTITVMDVSGLVKKTQRSQPKKEKQQEPEENQTTTTYTVVWGDCLWRIAEMFLGNGARYMEIYEMNKGVIDAHGYGPNFIRPGDVLTVPKT